MTNILTAYVVTKMYPEYKPAGTLPKEKIREINCRIRDLFTSKIGAVIVNSADTIVISAFLGLTVLAVYQNYFFILNAIIGVVAIIFGACMAGIGNSIIVESKEKNFNDLNIITFIIAWIAGFCTTCLMCLYQPFMEIWVGEDWKLKFSAVICFCIYYFIYEINQLLTTYKDAAGIWHEDRFRPLVTAMVNLALNLLMVQVWGIYGVILSTVLSTILVGMPWLLHNLFTVLFRKEELVIYLKKLLYYMVITVLGSFMTYIFCMLVQAEPVITLLLRGILCCIISNVCYFIAYWRTPELKQSVQLINEVTKEKISFLKKLELLIGEKS